MAIRYRKVQFTNMNSDMAGWWYPRATVVENVSLAALCTHMANHHSVYSEGVIKGVLSEMVDCIKELLLEGKSVTIDDLAIFSVGLRTSMVENLEDFDVSKQVKAVRLRARATGKLTNTNLGLDAELKELTEYTSPTTDSTSTSSSSSSSSGSSSSGTTTEGGDDSGDDGDISV